MTELDRFVKRELKVEYYIRYVDDFVIFHRDKTMLAIWKTKIDNFLKSNLKIELHPEKTRILLLEKGITFLGFRIFPKYRLLKKSNTRWILKRLEKFKRKYEKGLISQEQIAKSIEGWLAYAEFADTYNLRKSVILRTKALFPN